MTKKRTIRKTNGCSQQGSVQQIHIVGGTPMGLMAAMDLADFTR